MTTSQVRRLQGTAPTGMAAAAVGSGGSFAAATYFWKITAVGPWGEGAPSNEASAAIVLNGSANLTWAAPPAGTSAVRVYRGTSSNAQNVLVVQLQGSPVAYTDTGTGAAGAPPAVSAWSNITKAGTTSLPLKSNVPAGTPAGLAQQLYAAMCDWCSVGVATANGTSNQARLGDKVAAGAGFDLQEV